MRNIIVCISLLVGWAASAQQGDHLLTHFNPSIQGIDNMNFDMTLDENGLLHVANRSGLLQFDGNTWDFTSTPMAMLSLDVAEDGTVFSGGVNDLGYFGFSDSQFQFISLLGEQEVEDLFFDTQVLANNAYFLSETKLAIYELSTQSLRTLEGSSEDFFLNSFIIDSVYYVQSESELLQVNGDSLITSELKLPDQSDVQFVKKSPYGEDYIIGSGLNQLYLFKNGSFRELKVSGDINSRGLFAFDGTWVSEGLFAVSTLESGCLVVDVSKDRIESVINYESGLPDNEVLSIAADQDKGLWIAHEYGLTRMVPQIPITTFSNYPGLTGNLLTSTRYLGKTYVSTSSGVFYFDEEKRYRNNVYYTLQKTSTRKVSQPKESKPQTAKSTKKKKKGIGGLFRKKSDKTEDPKKDGEEKKGFLGRIVNKIGEQLSGEVKTLKGRPKKNAKYVRRVRRELISSKFLYKKVDGLDFKTKQLIPFKEHLLAVSNSGLYEIKDSVASLVVDDVIRYAHATDEYVLLATGNHEIRVFELLDDLWIESQSFELAGEIIVGMFNDHKDRIWIISSNSIHQFDPSSFDQADMIFAEFPNQFIDKVRGTVINDQIYLINSSGYFYYDEMNDRIRVDSTLLDKLGKPIHHLQQSDGVVWVYDGQSWTSIGSDKYLKTYEMLGLFPDMTSVEAIGDELWIIDKNEKLYRFNSQEERQFSFRNKTFIRNVLDEQGKVRKTGEIDFDFSNNSITFEISRPDYLGISRVEYQYQLKGLMNDWSEWSSNQKVDFNYLPPGEYTLVARSRDVYGETQYSGIYTFSIDPPYWQTPWFYAIQVIVFASLVIGSTRLNRGKNKGKYFLLTEGLTLFTIVLIIEFLQTVAGASFDVESSPVFDFMMDASIALLILPLELLLKRVIKSGAEVQQLKQIIKPKQSG